MWCGWCFTRPKIQRSAADGSRHATRRLLKLGHATHVLCCSQGSIVFWPGAGASANVHLSSVGQQWRLGVVKSLAGGA